MALSENSHALEQAGKAQKKLVTVKHKLLKEQKSLVNEFLALMSAMDEEREG